jgi:hypothetical protein
MAPTLLALASLFVKLAVAVNVTISLSSLALIQIQEASISLSKQHEISPPTIPPVKGPLVGFN